MGAVKGAGREPAEDDIAGGAGAQPVSRPCKVRAPSGWLSLGALHKVGSCFAHGPPGLPPWEA
jgi:hypothetical protein